MRNSIENKSVKEKITKFIKKYLIDTILISGILFWFYIFIQPPEQKYIEGILPKLPKLPKLPSLSGYTIMDYHIWEKLLATFLILIFLDIIIRKYLFSKNSKNHLESSSKH